jgi:hypothetical protein
MVVYLFVFYFADSAARCAYRMVMLSGNTRQFILYIDGCELMAHNNFGIKQQFDCVVYGCAAYVEVVVFQLFPYRVESEKRFVPAHLCKYGVTFRRMSEFFFFQIFGKQFHDEVFTVVRIIHFYFEILFNG